MRAHACSTDPGQCIWTQSRLCLFRICCSLPMLRTFQFPSKPEDKIQTQGKAQTASQPSTVADAMNSSKAKSARSFPCRSQMQEFCQDEGFAQSLQGNICFKGVGLKTPSLGLSLPTATNMTSLCQVHAARCC